MDRRTGIGLLIAVTLVAAWPATASADHCGAAGAVTPASGPGGTTFVFETNLGDDADIRIARDGVVVIRDRVQTDGTIRYEIRTRSGDAGDWTVDAALVGHPGCRAEASFTVTGLPGTSTAARVDAAATATSVQLGLLVLVAVATFGWQIRRSRRPATPVPSASVTPEG
jgi:hypothetical protein